MLAKILYVPKIETEDYFEKARFALAWRIGLSFSIVTFIIGMVTFFSSDPFFLHYLAVFITVTLSNIYMFVTKKYKLVSAILTILVTLIIVSSLFTIKDAAHVIEMLWLIVITLFSYFTLGRWWGLFYTLVSIVVYIIYFNTLFPENIASLANMKPLMWKIISVEFTFAMVLVSYIISQFFAVNKIAEKNRLKAFNELKKEKELVEKQNQEKTYLLQEIHHRVKNNLQIIISLLRIQSGELKSKEAKKSFNEAVNRIMTMSLVHQKMYEKDSLSNIDFKDYLNSLISEIKKSYASKNVIVNTDIQMLTMNPKSIVTVALLINELLTNSIKHAFQEKGEVFIKAYNVENKDNVFILEYKDNGSWKVPKGEKSFGLQLIDTFVEQLDGSFERNTSDKGTSYTFTFAKLA